MSEQNEVNVKRMEQTALSWPQRAQAIAITDQGSYDHAATMIVEVTNLERQIVEHHDPIIKAAFAAHRVACDAKKKLLDPLTQAKTILKKAIGDWDREQERIRLEQEEAAQAELNRLEEEERLRLAVEAEKAKAPEETVQEILATPTIVMPRPVMPATYQKMGGVSTSLRWRAEVIDIRALCRAVANGQASPELVQANMTSLNGMARAMKNTMNIPGVRAVTETAVAVRRTA